MAQRLVQIVSSLEACDETATMMTVSLSIQRDGFLPAVLSLHGDGPLAEPLRKAGIEVYWVEPPIRHSSQLVYRVTRELRRLRPDLVHTWTNQANQVGRLAAIAARVPRLISSHRSIFPRPSSWSQVVNRSLTRWTDVCVVNSETAMACHRKRIADDGKLRLIVDGVPVRQRVSPSDREQVRERLGLPKDAKLVGVVGPLIPGKRVKDAIWATDLLRVFYQDLYLLVVGSGPESWRLQRYSSQIQDRRRTVFLGDRVDRLELIGAFDCLCQPGQYESMPRAVLDAMAVGVPVVATDLPGHQELIEADATGVLVPVGQRGVLARRLYSVLDDPSLAERLGTAAQSFVRRKHTVEAMIGSYCTLYHQTDPAVDHAPVAASGSSPSIP